MFLFYYLWNSGIFLNMHGMSHRPPMIMLQSE